MASSTLGLTVIGKKCLGRRGILLKLVLYIHGGVGDGKIHYKTHLQLKEEYSGKAQTSCAAPPMQGMEGRHKCCKHLFRFKSQLLRHQLINHQGKTCLGKRCRPRNATTGRASYIQEATDGASSGSESHLGWSRGGTVTSDQRTN